MTNRLGLPPQPVLCGTATMRNSHTGTAAHTSSSDLKLSWNLFMCSIPQTHARRWQSVLENRYFNSRVFCERRWRSHYGEEDATLWSYTCWELITRASVRQSTTESRTSRAMRKRPVQRVSEQHPRCSRSIESPCDADWTGCTAPRPRNHEATVDAKIPTRKDQQVAAPRWS